MYSLAIDKKQTIAQKVELAALGGGTVTVHNRDVAVLRRRLQGTLLLPGDNGYDVSRTIWNRLIDRRPTLSEREHAEITPDTHFADLG